MTCPHCTRAAEIPAAYNLADAACHGCAVRAVARGHWLRWSMSDGRQLPAYRELLARTGVAHEEAKQWINVRGNRETTA